MIKPDFRPWLSECGTAGNLLRILSAFAGLLCLFYGIIPFLGYGIFHSGVFVLLIFGSGFALFVLFGEALRRRFPRLFLWGWRLFCFVFLLALCLYLLFAVSYRRYCTDHPPVPGEEQTLIVLGGAIEGEHPKLMLTRRLQAAAVYLAENPQAVCIVSGGQGADEIIPEALAMENYLHELGIAAERIRREDRSKNTRQNIAFSAEIIRQEGLPERVVVATDRFHQLRAGYFCQKNGLQACALCSLTPWGLLPSYEIREMGAWVKALLEAASLLP